MNFITGVEGGRKGPHRERPLNSLKKVEGYLEEFGQSPKETLPLASFVGDTPDSKQSDL